MSTKQKVALLRGSVEPIMCYMVVGRPFSKTRAKELDSLQQSMVGKLLRLPAHTWETKDEYFARRARTAAHLIGKEQRWSRLWAKRTLDWIAHIKRHDEHIVFPVYMYRNSDFLQSARAQALWGNGTIFGGRTQTRAVRGHPTLRFEACLEAAK